MITSDPKLKHQDCAKKYGETGHSDVQLTEEIIDSR